MALVREIKIENIKKKYILMLRFKLSNLTLI